jgi:hypothetical protein
MAATTTRALWSRFFAVVFVLLLPLATIATWSITTVTNTDRWVATLHPLATNRTITNYLAAEGAKTLINELHVDRKIESALGKNASFLTTTITAELQRTFTQALEGALRSSTFVSIWDHENRLTHQVAVDILDNKYGGKLSTARDVVLNVSPAVVSAINALDAQGITLLNPLRDQLTSDKLLELRLLDDRELQRAQSYYRLAVTLKWVLPALVVILGLLVVFTSRPRRRGARRLSLALIVSAAATYCLLRVAIALAAPLAPTPLPVTKAILRAATAFLARELVTLTLVGVAGLLLCWTFGEGAAARSLRAALTRGVRMTSGTVSAHSKELAHTNWQSWSVTNAALLLRYLRGADVVAGVIAVSLLLLWVNSLGELLAVTLLGVAWSLSSHRLHQRLSSSDAPDATNSP